MGLKLGECFGGVERMRTHASWADLYIALSEIS